MKHFSARLFLLLIKSPFQLQKWISQAEWHSLSLQTPSDYSERPWQVSFGIVAGWVDSGRSVVNAITQPWLNLNPSDGRGQKITLETT